MARLAGGIEHIEAARRLLKSAKSADELRLAQAVLLPLELGMRLETVAACIGRSVGATCLMRTRFAKVASGLVKPPRSKTQLRNRAHVTLEVEAAALDKIMDGAQHGAVVVIPRLKAALEKELGKSVAVSSMYRMLHRHGWRKLAPDTAHPQGDAQAREEWKKNSPTRWQKLQPSSSASAPSN